jgi:hypothetical protein
MVITNIRLLSELVNRVSLIAVKAIANLRAVRANHTMSALMFLTKWVLAVVSGGEVYLIKTILDGALWVGIFWPSLSFSIT